ncbi:hypothetical protein G6L93_18900 [Agrobacterium rhizogenes]|uniref:Uncharacterized protein n=1 Tax=Rhizobium rhizogenes (strain K84 / ATCC BAA-868) TaxID=311403 RepID=B9JE36_RHIR8|nr:hypothetical protein Arad_4751 [Rhizobium rhizogenes K84]NTI95770.1 hypothetical protein [Rhizobium rhizogenes]NTJ58240.1 hypothetical protein [Rhizobium rhizogenes]
MFGWTVDAKLAGGHVNFDMGYSDIFGGTVDRHDALLRLQTRQREVQLQLPRLWLFSAVFSRRGCPGRRLQAGAPHPGSSAIATPQGLKHLR